MATKPILVTGAQRSGTTWVGRMLAEAANVLYIHEPFNVTHPPGRGVCNLRSRYWFDCVAEHDEPSYRRALERTIALRYDWLAAARSAASLDDAREILGEYRRFRRHRRRGSIALIKDPLALFAAEWLASRFGMNVVVVIRHPAAFVSSIRLLGWSHPFDHFLRQPRLIDHVLAPFRAEIEAFAATERPVFDQAVLLWRLIYHTVLQYRQRHPDWIFVRHEDLSRDPIGRFRDLFARLDLPFKPEVQVAIRAYSGQHNPTQPPEHIGSEVALKRHSAANLENWRSRLTLAEVEQVRSSVTAIAPQFYPEDDW